MTITTFLSHRQNICLYVRFFFVKTGILIMGNAKVQRKLSIKQYFD